MTKHKIPKAVLAIFQSAGRKGGKLAAKNMSKSALIKRARAAGEASALARRAAKKKR